MRINCAFAIQYGNGESPLSGYFDLTQIRCRLLKETQPFLYSPAAFWLQWLVPDSGFRSGRYLLFPISVTCLTATGSYRIYTCFPGQILIYHSTLWLIGQVTEKTAPQSDLAVSRGAVSLASIFLSLPSYFFFASLFNGRTINKLISSATI